MKRLVGGFRIIGILILFFVAFACEKMSIYNGQDPRKVHDVLISYYKDNVTINEYTIKQNVSEFSFSDGSVVGFDLRSINIVSIDIVGFWQINGERTDIELEKPGREIIPIGEDSSKIYGIVEGYTDWTFILGGGNEIVLKKTLFAYDPDTIIRGVNHRGFCSEAPRLKPFHKNKIPIKTPTIKPPTP